MVVRVAAPERHKAGGKMMVIGKKHSLMACGLALSMLAGCQSNPLSSGDATSADADTTRAQGAGVGALVGGLIGYAVTGDARGAVIGAAIGGGTGYLVGNEVAKRKQKYASEEDFLDAEIASAKEYNATARSYNKQLRGDIAQLEKQTKSLESRYKSGRVTKGELEKERANVQRQIASSKKFSEDLKKEYEIKLAVLEDRRKSKGGNDPYVKQLQREIASLKKNMDQLESQSVQLAQLDERLSL
jgi:hypothetical protein